MTLLDVKTRQTYLKELGFYTDEIDGIDGKNTKKAYKDLQNKYFTRTKDKDGIYGKNTDILLRNAYNFRDIKYFRLEKFKCKCKGKYCTGYPAVMSRELLLNIDDMRTHFGVPFYESSGLRCKTWNSLQPGSSKTSRHLDGKAFDFSASKTKTLIGRKELINYWIKNYKKARYAYSNGYYNNGKVTGKISANSMGTCVHVDVQ